MIATKGKVRPTSVCARMVASCQPIARASGGNIGRMYEGSLELDRLKKTKMNAAHTSARRCQQNPLRSAGASVHMRRAVQAKTVTQGSSPTRKMGTKYHHAPSR